MSHLLHRLLSIGSVRWPMYNCASSSHQPSSGCIPSVPLGSSLATTPMKEPKRVVESNMKEPARGQDDHSPQWQASRWWDQSIWGSPVCYKASCTQKWLRRWRGGLASPPSNVRSDSSVAGHPWQPGRSWMCSVPSHVYLEPPLGWWPFRNTLGNSKKKKKRKKKAQGHVASLWN